MAMYQTPSIGSAITANPTTLTPSAWGTPPTPQQQQQMDPFVVPDPNAANTWGDAFKAYVSQNDPGYQDLQKQYDTASSAWSKIYEDPAWQKVNAQQSKMMSDYVSGNTQGFASADAFNKKMMDMAAPWTQKTAAGQATMDAIQARQEDYFRQKFGGVYDQLGGLQRFQAKYGVAANPVIDTITALFNKQFGFKNPWSVPR